MVRAAPALALLLASVPLGACAVDGEEKTAAFDYHQYMPQSTAAQGNQYVSKYAGSYQGYMRTNASGADNERYAGDYQKYTEQLSVAPGHANQSHGFGEYAKSYVPHLSNSSDSQEWAAYYAKKYAGKYQGGMENSSSDEEALKHSAKSYMDKYAAGYEHYAKARTGASSAPAAAGKCHNMTDLDAWREAQLERVRAYVPEAYRAPVQDKVEREFLSNRARIMREEAAEAQQHVHQASNQSADQASGVPSNRTEDASGERKPPVRESDAAQQHVDDSADRPATKSPAKVHAKRAEDSSPEQKPRTEESDAAVKPPAATAVAQLASQGFDGEQELAESARRNGIDRSMALIGSMAALGAIVSALVIDRRNQQSSLQPEGYVNLEP